MFRNNLPKDRKDLLLNGLTQLPQDWALTPLLGNKAPYRDNWQHETPISLTDIQKAIQQGDLVTYTKKADGSTYQKRQFPQGYGIRTGIISGGIVAVDLDGPSATPKVIEMSGGAGLPKTVAFTSGRPGRSQHLFKIPEQYWSAIKTTKYKTGTIGDDGKPEQVEFRWDGCQSVLPPSVHPTTGQYRWVQGCAPWEREVASAPLWLIELMLSEPAQDPAPLLNQPAAAKFERSQSEPRWTDTDWALSYLNSLSPSRADDYDEWLAVGMALQSVSDSLLADWDRWSSQSSKYKPGDCDKKWKSFKSSGVSIGSLAHMAKQDGWLSPFERNSKPSLPTVHSDTIEEVKQRVDIVDIISEHVALKKRGKDFLGLCPFHDEKTPSFIVSPAKQSYDCFACGAAGNVIKFLMELGKHSFSDVVLDLARRYQIQARSVDGSPIPLPTKNPLNFQKRSRGNGGSGGGTPPVSSVSLRDRVLEILNRNHSSSERKAAFIELAKSIGIHLREVEQLAEAIESEVNLTEGRADRATELESLLSIGDRRLTLTRYLHPNLADPLERLAGWMGIDSEALLTVLLPTAASLLHPETRVIAKECIDFVEPMVIYAGIVSESGNRKSPTFKAISKALRKLQNEEETRNKSAQESYKFALDKWKEDTSKDKGDPPEPPSPPREYFVDNITSEALDRIKSQQPGHGILIRKDELSGLFGSYGAYKGGKGSDKEGILSGWNGDGIKVNRAGGSRLSLSHDASSIVGAIQPGKLRRVMGDLEDEQGEWARFLWYFAPLRPFRLPDDDTRFEVGDLLEGVYRKLDKLTPIQYRFTSDAQRVYQDWHWTLDQRRCAEPRQGMRAALAKMQGYTVRIAGILHVLWATAAGEEPEKLIPVERVRAAKALIEFYLGQVRLIHSDAEAAQGELTPILESIIKKARQLGQLSARTAQSSIKALRSYKTDKILECFRELTAMGLATIDGKTLIPEFDDRADQSADRADQMLTKVLTATQMAVSIDNTSLQPFKDQSADLADRADHFSEQSSQSEVVEDNFLNNAQQNQQVSTLGESLTESGADRADQMLTKVLTATQMAVSIDNTSLQPFKDQSADLADRADHFSEQSSQSEVVEDNFLNNAQQNQQVSTLGESLTESGADRADHESASGSAKITSEFSPVLVPPEPEKPAPAAEAEFKVGDAVALADSYMVAYAYHGIVEEVAGDKISVRWAERQGKANECEVYHASELRLLH